MAPLSSTAGPDPFASKKAVLGAISPQKDTDKENEAIGETNITSQENSQALERDRSSEGAAEEEKEQVKEKENTVEEGDGTEEDELVLEKDKQTREAAAREAAALQEAERLLAEEIRQEEEALADKGSEQGQGNKELINTKITTTEEKDCNDEGNTIDLNNLTQADDEFHELTMSANQEAKINQILNIKGKNHMSAYQQSMSSLSLDIPLLKAVFKDDIDTVKLYLHEDFSDCVSGNPDDHFLSVRDSRGRTALHVAAAGDSPLMVEYLLTHTRVCLEQKKHEELQKIKEERKVCLMELKMSMKKNMEFSGQGRSKNKSLSDSFSKDDYRVAAIEKWFEGEVGRIHRKVELLVEGYWLSGLLQRDKQGLSPLHYAVHTGSLDVLRALLCVPPFFSGRGVFSAAQQQQELRRLTRKTGQGLRTSVKRVGNTEKPYEWFIAGGVYNSLTGEEVAVVHKLQTIHPLKGDSTAKGCDDRSRKNKLTLHDVAQVSSFNAYISPSPHQDDDDDMKPKVDYDIVVPWLVRNLYKRSVDMGKKLGATAMDVLEEMIEMVNPSKGRVLILPEIREWLRYLGIVVTTDVIKELCNIYPAETELVKEKYELYRDNEEEMLQSDSKSFSSNFPNASKISEKKTSKSSESKLDSDTKSTDDGRAGESKSRKSSKGSGSSKKSGDDDDFEDSLPMLKKSLFDPSGEEASYGLALDMLFDDIASGQGMKSIFSDTPVMTHGDDMLKNGDKDHIKSGLEDTVGSAGNVGTVSRSRIEKGAHDCFQMPDVVSVTNILQYRKILLNCRDGAGNTALLVAAALGKLNHLEELLACGADIDVQSVDLHTPLSVAKNPSVIGVLQRELVALLKVKRDNILRGNDSMRGTQNLSASKDFVDTMKSTPNDGTMLTTNTNTSNSDDVVLQLHDLKTKRWAYSQSALTWAVEGGMTDAMEQMLSQGIDANEVDVSGRSPLHVCMYLGSQASDAQALLDLRKMTEAILNNGGDVSATTISGKTPLHELFSKNKSPHMETISAAECALLNRLRAAVVRSMLQWGSDPLKPDRQGYTSLYYCAKENMTECMIEMLKTKGININFQDHRGRTVLHTACIFGSESVASVIANYDADYVIGVQCVADKDGKTAKHLISPHMPSTSLITIWQACRNGNVARVNSILAKQRTKDNLVAYEGVEEEQAPRNPLDVTSGQEDSIQDLWLLGGVDCKTRIHKWTPLHACIIGWAEFNAMKSDRKTTARALRHGEKKTTRGSSSGKNSFRNLKASYPASLTVASFSTILSVLIQNFAYVDSLEFKCRTPLMLAAAFDLPAAVTLLCTAGADVNLRDLDGNTALHYAYACGSNQAMSALESLSASSDITNNAGDTPFEVVGLIDSIAPIFK
eukprot:CAMPEP_0114452376 /NCGR_PEP_ID=MMETSP0104-20121206/1482_1 /TAXON_ID=37642 ORGANISM="Paraphysomonas imperforata, Strain PA2" /NCGR_SAMPLE_ID=MMETSP0104 /ASSEMBLY_ACC=CAM_ASM_000202 /LENGTH=1372 /DNA_ID=CAMNT_0001624623 /DNA_START=163 /DNA_END=4281 /DNA_ORIENTATION=+